MKFYDVPAQSPEWERLRIGIPTASSFNRIITPKTLKLSAQASDYANELIAERILNQKLEKFPKTYWMERGQEMEGQALQMFKLLNDDLDISRGGFFEAGHGEFTGVYGASPDLRMMKDGVIIGAAEIKCPAPWTHVENLLRDKVDPDYKLQVQGQILAGDLKFHQWFSYHPDMPPVIITTERDDNVCSALQDGLEQFNRLLSERLEKLTAKGVVTFSGDRKPTPVPGATLEDFLSAA